MPMPPEYQRLLEIMGEVDDLKRTLAVLNWDEKTKMPSSGGPARAQHKATLERLVHQRLASPELDKLLEKLTAFEDNLEPDSDEKGILRVTRRLQRNATALPEDLVIGFSQARSRAFTSWVEAREAKDYTRFIPAIEEIVEYSRKSADALSGGQGDPRQPLLELSEPGMELEQVETLFQELRDFLVPLTKKIFDRVDAVDDSLRYLNYPVEKQWAVGMDAVRYIGYRLDQGRADTTVHPFATSFAVKDTRITTRVYPDDVAACLFALLHEAGHAQYMQGLPERFERTPLADGASMGMHESQSRLWENLVGRSRPFWNRFFERMQKEFPQQLGEATPEIMYRTFNRVKPSLIRVEADEVTYNLHIIIRYELQKEVFNGELDLKDLADAWNAKFRSYLGIEPPDDKVGVLQDVHFSGGFGISFVSYTLGNVINAQLYDAAVATTPGLADAMAQGDFSGLLKWTRDYVHCHGNKYTPAELVKKATGKELSTESFQSYISKKFTDLYQL